METDLLKSVYVAYGCFSLVAYVLFWLSLSEALIFLNS